MSAACQALRLRPPGRLTSAHILQVCYKAALEALVKGMEKEPGVDVSDFIAHFYGELNDRDRTFAVLEKALESHTLDVQFLKVDPFWSDNLGSDPRFADLVRRVGLPQ